MAYSISAELYTYYYWVNLIWTWICSIFTFCILFIQTYNVIVDLCTKSRKSLSHLEQMPIKSNMYQNRIILTLISITLYFISICSSGIRVIIETETTDNTLYHLCKILLLSRNLAEWIAKLLLWIVFLFKLHLCYDGTVYAYSTKTLIVIGIFEIVFTFVMFIMFTINSNITVLKSENRCYLTAPLYFHAIAILCELMNDALFLYFFINPIKKLSIVFKDNSSTNGLMEIAMQTLVLTSTICIMSIINMFWIVITGGTGLFHRITVVVSCICLVLMTPYYPKHKYFHKICCLMNKCCQKINKIKVSKNITQLEMTVNSNTQNSIEQTV
eukprot:39192_1